MPDIRVHVYTPGGDVHPIDAPADIKAEEFIRESSEATNIGPWSSGQGALSAPFRETSAPVPPPGSISLAQSTAATILVL